MEIQIEMDDITPGTKVRLSLKDVVIISGIIISMTASGLTYFNVLPVQGAASTDIKDNHDLATKEYIGVNYVSKEKLQDTIINLQNQIDSYKETINRVDKKLDIILERLPSRYTKNSDPVN